MADDDAPRDGTPSTPAGGAPRPGEPDDEYPAGEVDRTAEYNQLAETAAGSLSPAPSPIDETRVGGPSGTGVPPPVIAATPRWSARAQVPTPQYDEGVDWREPEPPPRGLLVPALIAVCVLLLAALIGLGVWLALRNRETTPATPPSVPTSAAPTTASATTTSQPPTTTPAAPTTAAVTPVSIPPLAGQSYEDAVADLERLGFKTSRVDEPSTDVDEGDVIRTEPASGRFLPGTTIKVVVSSGPPATTPPATTPT